MFGYLRQLGCKQQTTKIGGLLDRAQLDASDSDDYPVLFSLDREVMESQ
jgi:hypothetical protein